MNPSEKDAAFAFAPRYAYNDWKDAKETTRYKWVLVVTKLLNIAVDYFDA